MQNWTTYQQAALDYSKLKPRQRSADITLVADQAEYDLPTDALSVRYAGWGEEVSFLEIATNTGTDQGWFAAEGTLTLSPAPDASVDDTALRIVYYARHLPDVDTQTFPTIAAADVHWVEDLEQAILLDLEADAVGASGTTAYTIGQTQVDRAAAIADLRARANALRARVRQALDEPLAMWR